MTTRNDSTVAIATAPPRTVRPSRLRAIRRSLSTPGGIFGISWLLLIVVASFTAPLWSPYGPNEQTGSVALAGPSAAHWLGTDDLGRDVLTRIFTAGADAIATSALGAAVALAVAIPLALWAASRGRGTETVINRVTEIAMSIPVIIIMLTVVGIVGTNLPLIMVILGLVISTGMYRVLLGQAKSLQSQLYVDAAFVDGLTAPRVSGRHVLPGLTTTIMVQFALVFSIGLMIQTGLAFIGFGPPVPAPSWGGMIQNASTHIYDAPWLMVPTGVVLILTVFAANSIGDALSGPREKAPVRSNTRSLRARRAAASAGNTEPTGSSPVAAPSATEPALSVQGLHVGLDDGTTLVSDVSFAVSAGRVLGLVGESGCGKTLTSLSLIGLLPTSVATTAGSILWNGRDIAALSEQELFRVRGREIAFIAQEPMRALDPMFSIGSQLTGAVQRLRSVPKREAGAIATALLEQVGIVDAARVLTSYPHEISGGMAQRVAIAIALAGRPRLLIADEPTTSLDVTVQAEILSLLRQIIAEEGMTMVMVTHDLGVVADICDDVAVMYAGQIVETGAVRSVLLEPAHPYTKALLGADPHATGAGGPKRRLVSIPGQVPAPRDWPSSCRFAQRCDFATAACSGSVPLTPRPSGAGLSRCIRAEELFARPTSSLPAHAAALKEQVD
ncbi:dipeptide/oligopeptide/nickel ABC transporter permease/ATP-binding protein [Microterricola pindariensis]|uniref:Peptide ABC transporter ATP-binding protein n=1 Tax=Microterricola pindariensis TaxID=478010 RepID=A0ABX5AWD0_9MICO|nr:dipeptide/oligopeptide/nickel ABC transporter permease/ATP-binding protein [Microterricola pindariensis]PPL19150.1 peptide ABC transporter ATP-binding protein [Microterricola pindariensis]